MDIKEQTYPLSSAHQTKILFQNKMTEAKQKEVTSPLSSAHQTKNLFQKKMTETKQKCNYFYSGFCKYKDKFTFAHPMNVKKDAIIEIV